MLLIYKTPKNVD